MGIHVLEDVSAIRPSEVQLKYVAVDVRCTGEMSAYRGRRGV